MNDTPIFADVNSTREFDRNTAKSQINAAYGKIPSYVETDSFVPEPEPGFIARSRKAIIAGAASLAGALAVAVPTVFGDGVLTSDEIITTLIIATGVGLSVALATWATPNAK